MWICFNFRLAGKNIYVIVKNHKIWNQLIINQLNNPSRTISEWEPSVSRCYLCYSLPFSCSSPSKNPCSTEHQTHAALQTHVSMCDASSKSAFTHYSVACEIWQKKGVIYCTASLPFWSLSTTFSTPVIGPKKHRQDGSWVKDDQAFYILYSDSRKQLS